MRGAAPSSSVVIGGSGHGGTHAGIQLRQAGVAGALTIVTAEADPPYERPPLSKEYRYGDRPTERLLIRPESYWRTIPSACCADTR